MPGAVAFLCAAALVLTYALLDGSYDILVFETEAVILWAIIGLGYLFGVLPRARPSRLVVLFGGALLAYVAWTALSLTWTESAERTTEEIARCLSYLGLVVLIASAVDRDTWQPAAGGLVVGALLVSLISVASRLDPGAFPANAVGAAFDTERLSYPLGYWNAVSAWGAMATTLAIAWSAHDTNRPRRAIMLALVPPATVATYLGYSRASIAATVLGALLVLAIARNRVSVLVHIGAAAAAGLMCVLVVRGAPQIAQGTGTSGAGTVVAVLLIGMALCGAAALATAVGGADKLSLSRGAARFGVAALVVVVLVAAAAAGPRLVRDGWHSFTRPAVAQGSNPSTRLLSLSGNRDNLWRASLDAFDAHPTTGIGAGTFAFWWNEHATDAEFTHDAHSIWFQNLAELGWPGGILILLTLGLAAAVGVAARRRARRRATAGIGTGLFAAFVVYVLAASVDWMWEVPAITMLAIAAVSVAGGRLADRSGRIPLIARLAVVALAVGAVLITLPGLDSTIYLRRSQSAARTGNGALAIADASAAISAESWAASPYEQRALVEESAGELPAAIDDEQHAARAEPDNYAHWLILARLETEAGNIPAALRDVTTARRLRPLSSVFLYGGLLSARAPGSVRPIRPTARAR